MDIRQTEHKERQRRRVEAKMYAVASEVDRARLSVCCLQEVRYLGTGKKIIRLANGNEFLFTWSGFKKR